MNCATTMLKILAEIFEIKLDSQVLESAIGMHGAGKFGAQCGLVEGFLMFMGIYGNKEAFFRNKIVNICFCFAKEFEEKFNSLLCRELRPEGFKKNNPLHLCEGLTKRVVKFTTNYITNISGQYKNKDID